MGHCQLRVCARSHIHRAFCTSMGSNKAPSINVGKNGKAQHDHINTTSQSKNECFNCPPKAITLLILPSKNWEGETVPQDE